MPDFGGHIKIPDQRDIYPTWCRVFAHDWWREPYEYPPIWARSRSCRRCRDIPMPRRGESA